MSKPITLLLLISCIISTLSAAESKFPISTAYDTPLSPNEWVKIESYGAARRSYGALVWLPIENQFLLAMGVQGAWDDRGPFCYDEQNLNLKERLWKNRFPPDKDWSPELGPCKVPSVPYNRLSNGRLGLSESGFKIYGQYTYDHDSNRLVAYVLKELLAYDVKNRIWSKIGDGAPSGTQLKPIWGSLCYDAHNKEYLLFGGSNGESEFNDTRTWAFSVAKNEWKRIDPATPAMKALEQQAEALRLRGVALHGAACNRYFKTDLPDEAKTKLQELADKLNQDIIKLKKQLGIKADGYQAIQFKRTTAHLEAASQKLTGVTESVTPQVIKQLLDSTRSLWHARTALMSEPPPRAYSQMAYHPATRKIVLFGGDRLDMLYADTWVYDCQTRTWQEMQPAQSPSPRAAHSLLYLPDSGKIALLGGYDFDSQTDYWGPLYAPQPMQLWTYDIAANRWDLIKEWDVKSYRTLKGAYTIAAATGDIIVTLHQEKIDQFTTISTMACKVDLSTTATARQKEIAVPPDTVTWRTGPYDVNWYTEGDAPDEAAFQARIAAIEPNSWVKLAEMKKDKLPRQNRDWGTAVFDPDRQAIYRWSGGHSAHCGTDIPVFSMRTGRYHFKYPPAFPLDGMGSQASQPSRSSFLAQPWISAHSYHSYAYNPPTREMLCCGHNSYTFAYQPESGLWTHKPQPDPMRRDNFYTLTLCATPEGAYAWTLFGTLFHYNSQKADWEPVETSGEPLPKTACDKSSLVYDAKRNRLLLVHEALKGELIAVNLKTKVATRLTPENMETAAEGKLFWRETTYDVANDLLIVAMRPKDGPMVVYDCAANRWFTHETANRPVMDVSTGLMYDASRQLILTVNANSEVFALKLKR